MRKRFGLPVLEEYPKCYVAFLRKVRDLRNLGISEERLGQLWDLERKLISILNLDLGGGELSLIEGCAVEADPNYRLLLSNAELGVPLMAQEVQAGLDFQQRPGNSSMGKTWERTPCDCLVSIGFSCRKFRGNMTLERNVLKETLRWHKSLGIA